MSTISGRRLIGKAGVATETTCKFLVVSQYSQAATIDIDGQSIPVTFTPMGADAPAAVTPTVAGYYFHVTISSLSSNTSYAYTITQNGTPDGNLTFSGTLRTAPSSTDDFAVFLFSCSGGTSDQGYAGAWNAVKTYSDAAILPVVACLGVDDTIYADSITLDDSGGTGHKVFNPITEADADTEYDACVRWMVGHGMVDTNSGTRVADYKEVTRAWCIDNINQVYLWGDHEVFNDVGYGHNTVSGSYSGTYRKAGSVAGGLDWQTPSLFAKRETAFDIFCSQVNGTALDVESQGFHCTYGPLHYIAIDRNYGDGNNWEGAGRFTFSSGQIAGVHSALTASNAEFRIVGSPSAYHEGTDVAPYYDLYNSDVTNTADIYTDTTNSLMQKHLEDGSKWCQFTGDFHVARATQHGRRDSGQLKEDFMEFAVSLMAAPNSNEAIGDNDAANGWYDWTAADYLSGTGVEKEWRRVFDTSLVPNYPTDNPTYQSEERGECLLVEVFGSETPKRMKCSIVSESGTRYFEATYLNDGFTNLPSEIKTMANLTFTGATRIVVPDGEEVFGCSQDDGVGGYNDRGIRLSTIDGIYAQRVNQAAMSNGVVYYCITPESSTEMALSSIGGNVSIYATNATGEMTEPKFSKDDVVGGMVRNGVTLGTPGVIGGTSRFKMPNCSTATTMWMTIAVTYRKLAGAAPSFYMGGAPSGAGPGISLTAETGSSENLYWTFDGSNYLTWSAISASSVGEYTCTIRQATFNAGAFVSAHQYTYGMTAGPADSAGVDTAWVDGGTGSNANLTSFGISQFTNTTNSAQMFAYLKFGTSLPTGAAMTTAAQWMAQNPHSGIWPGFSAYS